MNQSLSCFKAYDIRGKLSVELDEGIAYRIGRSTAQILRAKSIVVGFDARATSPGLAKSVVKGICDAGADAFEIGLAGTEEMYWAVSSLNSDGGIEVTASHNPIDYNGMKIVKHGSQPLSSSEFNDIKALAETNKFLDQRSTGTATNKINVARNDYLNKILSFIDLEKLMPLKIVINSGNGAAGPVIDALGERLEQLGVKTFFVKVNHNPDPSFPNGIPNPLLEENQSSTSEVIKEKKADFGVAFDGDFDRCFIFDHLGRFISGEYVVGFLSEIFLRKQKGQTIIHDPRVTWNTLDVIKSLGGSAILSKTGHAFIKTAMRKENAIYGGEMSAHHYFRDFSYCDSGMIPWLLIWELLSEKNIVISDLLSERKQLFPSSGEINFPVSNASKCLALVKDLFWDNSCSIDDLDGISVSFKNWRFNLRKSNTEPLVRLNVETRGDEPLLRAKTEELTKLISEL